jgi:hypothetical protein
MKSRNSEAGFMAFLMAFIMVIVVGVGGGLWYFYYREGLDPFISTMTAGEYLERENEPKGTGDGTNFARGDIDDDGVVNATDIGLLEPHVGCDEASDCWGIVVGKTKTGDNPYYTSDLDLDMDGKITELDVEYVRSRM